MKYVLYNERHGDQTSHNEILFLIRDQLCEKQKSIWCQKSQFFHLKQAMTKQELTTTFCTKIMLNAYCVEIDFLTHPNKQHKTAQNPLLKQGLMFEDSGSPEQH